MIPTVAMKVWGILIGLFVCLVSSVAGMPAIACGAGFLRLLLQLKQVHVSTPLLYSALMSSWQMPSRVKLRPCGRSGAPVAIGAPLFVRFWFMVALIFNMSFTVRLIWSS